MKIFKVNPENLRDSEEAIIEAAKVMLKGGVVVFPTDTVYGLGCDATDEAAIRKVFRMKGRDKKKALAVVVRDASDAITVQGLDGHTIAWNPAAEQLYGWTEAEALRMNVRDRIPKALQPIALDQVQQLSQAQTLAPFDTRRLNKDGRVLDVALTATALLDESGKVYAIATTERASAAHALNHGQ